jgi:hypothetical protein
MAGPQAAKLPIPHNRSFRPRSALRKPTRKPGRERARQPGRGATRSGYGYRTTRSHFRRPEGHPHRVVATGPTARLTATPPAAKYG